MSVHAITVLNLALRPAFVQHIVTRNLAHASVYALLRRVRQTLTMRPHRGLADIGTVMLPLHRAVVQVIVGRTVLAPVVVAIVLLRPRMQPRFAAVDAETVTIMLRLPVVLVIVLPTVVSRAVCLVKVCAHLLAPCRVACRMCARLCPKIFQHFLAAHVS